MKIIIVIASQFIFSFSRSLNTRYTSKDKVLESVVSGFFVKTSWLLATYFGIFSLIEKDYVITCSYLIGGIIGDYLSFKIKI